MGGAFVWQPPLTAFLATSLMDILSTLVAFESGLPEGNFLPALLLGAGGTELMLVFKGFTVFLVANFVLRLTPFFPLLWRGLRLANWFLGLAVLSNTVQTMFL